MPFRLRELSRENRYMLEQEDVTGWTGVGLVERDGGVTFAVYSMDRLDEPLMKGFESPDEVLDAYIDWLGEQGAAGAETV